MYIGFDKVYPMAIPIKGAVQGLAIKTANKPVKNALTFCLAKEIRPTLLAKGFFKLTKSNNIKNTIKKITIIHATNAGDWS